MRAGARPRWYRRITSSGRYSPEIDGLRFLAIVPVLLLHLDTWVGAQWAAAHPGGAPGAVSAVLQWGGIGVWLFFVLSGLVLGEPFARQARGLGARVPLGAYFRRRLTRIEPPYLVNLLALAALVALVRHPPGTELARHLAASAAYVHGPVYGTMSTINGVAWSLEVEVQFYLAAPLLALAYRLRRPAARRGMLVALAAAAAVAHPRVLASPGWRLSLAAYLPCFLAGMLLADLRATRAANGASPGDAPPRGRSAAIAVALVVLAAGCRALQLATGSVWLDALASVAAPAAIAGAFDWALGSPRARRLLSLTGVSAIGGMCYTLYLYHAAVIAGAGRLARGVGAGLDGYPAYLLVQAAILLPIVLATGAALFVVAERPFMDPGWPRRLYFALRRPDLSHPKRSPVVRRSW